MTAPFRGSQGGFPSHLPAAKPDRCPRMLTAGHPQPCAALTGGKALAKRRDFLFNWVNNDNGGTHEDEQKAFHGRRGRRFDRGALNEMDSLAKELAGRPVVTVHRDFQSQNILIRDCEAWLIDFQGLRQGCAFYDFASLAFDPYLTRPDMDLWRIEIEDHAREVSEWKGSADEFTHLLHVAAAQRLLQACGAYAFLGRKQGRADFLAHLQSRIGERCTIDVQFDRALLALQGPEAATALARLGLRTGG